MSHAVDPSPLLAYFRGEKGESLVFLAAGLLSLALSGWLLARGGPARAMAFPVLGVGLIQLAVGAGILLRTDGQVAALLDAPGRDPAAMAAGEITRMGKVMANFRVYKAVEGLFLVMGLGLVASFPARAPWSWAGAGFLAQGAFMLVLDLVAEARGRAYLAWLRGL